MLPFIADRGSFTLFSGVLTDEYLHSGIIRTTINHFVDDAPEWNQPCRPHLKPTNKSYRTDETYI